MFAYGCIYMLSLHNNLISSSEIYALFTVQGCHFRSVHDLEEYVQQQRLVTSEL